MKKLLSFTMICFCLVFVYSCKKNVDPIPIPQKDNMVTIPIKLVGLDLTASMEPMTRAGETGTTNYFFAVTQDGNPYAWYCMDSFEDVSISLVKGHTYSITGYVAYDQTGSFYWTGTVGGSIINLSTTRSNGFEYSDSKKNSIDTPLRSYNYRMFACSETFNSLPETITLNMYSVYYGIKINTTNLKEGQIEVSLGKQSNTSYAYNESLVLTAEEPTISSIYHFLQPLDVVRTVQAGNEYDRDLDITIKYTDADNNTSVLHSGQISIARLKYTILDIKLNDGLGNNAACNLSYEAGSISDGETLSFVF